MAAARVVNTNSLEMCVRARMRACVCVCWVIVDYVLCE